MTFQTAQNARGFGSGFLVRIMLLVMYWCVGTVYAVPPKWEIIP